MADYNNRQQHDTPVKAKVWGAIEYLEAKEIPHYKEDVFQHFKVSHCQGWAMISDNSIDRRHHHTEGPEHRGRPSVKSNYYLRHYPLTPEKAKVDSIFTSTATGDGGIIWVGWHHYKLLDALTGSCECHCVVLASREDVRIRRGIGTTLVQVTRMQFATEKERCAATCRNHTTIGVLSVVGVTPTQRSER
ncbi:hypothetical protein BU25DRAFT_422285 [Macroventuria anomochaeta]|uniref:Uncharacterized protein n=1 Tax=Macroventuria anomochaeta TaxID=301207 RepID=A0ACB6RZ28_9PLEO|nr:uncharacterized protein BU25DRAFT_422285 [Macroventuria anomochaeta]KAF2626972.1 hypothetical protein BU25DRAFT_422285 [Macroventuria anomochaeta]